MSYLNDLRLRTQIGILGGIGTLAVLLLIGLYTLGEQKIGAAAETAGQFARLERFVAAAEAGTLRIRRHSIPRRPDFHPWLPDLWPPRSPPQFTPA